METPTTRRFFNSAFVIKHKLSFSTVVILQDIYRWIMGKHPPKSMDVNGKTYYYISETHIADLNYGLLNHQRIGAIFKELKAVGVIESSIIADYCCHYLSFNWKGVTNTVLGEKEMMDIESDDWYKRIHAFAREQLEKEQAWKEGRGEKSIYDTDYEIVVKNGRNYLVKKKNAEKKAELDRLLDDSDLGLKVCPEANAIAKLILKRYGNFFSHKVPKEGEKPTKTYTEIVRKISDIHNGTFGNSRYYALGEKFLNNTQFNLDGWKEKVREAKGDWLKVKKLVLSALKNFELMHEKNRLPYTKDYLQTNLNLWFYDPFSDSDNPQSQFILSLNEPEFTKKHNSEAKADRIFNELSDRAKMGGNKLFSLNEDMPSGSFWQKVKEMVEWGETAFEFEPSITSWLMSASELPELFAQYCEDKGLSISIATLDIERAVDTNAPWTWFVKDACLKYGLNPHLSELVTVDDFVDCYG